MNPNPIIKRAFDEIDIYGDIHPNTRRDLNRAGIDPAILFQTNQEEV